MDHDGAGRFGGAEEHELSLKSGRDVLFLRRRFVARLLFDGHLGVVQSERLADLSLFGDSAAQSNRSRNDEPTAHGAPPDDRWVPASERSPAMGVTSCS